MDESDLSADQLSDHSDREELRRRYYGLLQELRVLLPGAQVLVAFMLSAPFASRFGDLDDAGRAIFGIALVAGSFAIIAFATPSALHRFGPRTARSERLAWGIRMARIGLVMLGVSLVSALVVVLRFVFPAPVGAVAGAVVGVALVGSWLVLPLTMIERDD